MKKDITKSRLHAHRKPVFLLCLFFCILLLLQVPATSKGKRFSAFNTYLQTDMSAGYWYSSREGSDYCIEFKGSRQSSTWNMSRCFNRGLFQKKENNVFVLTKETGTLQLTGNLEEEVGQGKYTFTPNAAFKQYLTDNNISSNDQNLLFHLFFGDVNKEYVQFLKKQYGEVSGERLLELAIHGISLENFKGYLALFQKHNDGIPSIKEVVAARIHGIDEAYVQELQRLEYQELSLNKMMEAKIHGVNAAYVESLSQAGFGKLPIDKIIAAKIHGVQPATVKEMQALGLGDLSLDKIIQLQIHGVKPAFLSDLKAAGFEGLTINQVLEAKIHGLNPATIKELKALGYKNLTFQEMVSAQIHGVNLAYVKDLQEAGFPNLTMDKTIAAKIHGVNGRFIKEAQEQGYNFTSIDKYISLKIHGLAMKSLKD